MDELWFSSVCKNQRSLYPRKSSIIRSGDAIKPCDHKIYAFGKICRALCLEMSYEYPESMKGLAKIITSSAIEGTRS